MFIAVAGEEQMARLMGTLETLASAFSAYEKAGSAHPLGDDDEG
jgi:hypothetical protein